MLFDFFIPFQVMAQGLKKHSKALGKKTKTRKPVKVKDPKKGQRICAPVKVARLREDVVRKQISKGINTNIEDALKKAMANDTHNFALVRNALSEEPKKKATKPVPK